MWLARRIKIRKTKRSEQRKAALSGRRVRVEKHVETVRDAVVVDGRLWNRVSQHVALREDPCAVVRTHVLQRDDISN